MQAVAQMPDCWRLAGSAHWIEHSKGTASADVTLANSQRSSGCVNLRPNPGEMSLRCHTAFQSRKHLPVLDSDLSRERSSSSIANEATSSSQLQRRRPFLRARPKSENIFLEPLLVVAFYNQPSESAIHCDSALHTLCQCVTNPHRFP